MKFVNTTPTQDKTLTKAEDAKGLFQELLGIIEDLDIQLSDAKGENDELHEQLRDTNSKIEELEKPETN